MPIGQGPINSTAANPLDFKAITPGIATPAAATINSDVPDGGFLGLEDPDSGRGRTAGRLAGAAASAAPGIIDALTRANPADPFSRQSIENRLKEGVQKEALFDPNAAVKRFQENQLKMRLRQQGINSDSIGNTLTEDQRSNLNNIIASGLDDYQGANLRKNEKGQLEFGVPDLSGPELAALGPLHEETVDKGSKLGGFLKAASPIASAFGPVGMAIGAGMGIAGGTMDRNRGKVDEVAQSENALIGKAQEEMTFNRQGALMDAIESAIGTNLGASQDLDIFDPSQGKGIQDQALIDTMSDPTTFNLVPVVDPVTGRTFYRRRFPGLDEAAGNFSGLGGSDFDRFSKG